MTGASVAAVRPGDGLLHPVALGALVVLVLNDRILKAAWPGPVTGKLSDVAGVILTPLVLVAAWEVLTWAAGRWRGPGRTPLAVAIVGVALGFAATQVWPPADAAYRLALGVAQWPFAAIGALITEGGVPPVLPVVAVADAADLIALPALAVTWWVGSRRVDRSAAPVVSGRASDGTP